MDLGGYRPEVGAFLQEDLAPSKALSGPSLATCLGAFDEDGASRVQDTRNFVVDNPITINPL